MMMRLEPIEVRGIDLQAIYVGGEGGIAPSARSKKCSTPSRAA
jgi:hypothetical protein